MRYELVIFDFDGTLADSGAWFLKLMDELADEFHFKRLDPRDHAKVRALHARDVLKHLEVPLWRLPQITRRTREYSLRDAHTIPTFPGISEMLARLKTSGISIAVVTSNGEESVHKILGPANTRQIDHFVCGASLFGKRAKLKSLLKQTGIDPRKAIYIGDELRDVTAARSAGVAFGAVAWGYTDATALRAAGPDHFFKTVDDIRF